MKKKIENHRGVAVAEAEPADYADRARIMNEEGRAELRRLLAGKAAELRGLVEADFATTLRGVNVAREIGAQVELFTGREKLSPPGFALMKPALEAALPDVTLEFAKRCLALHQRFPNPIEDYALATDEWAGVKQLVLALPPGGHGRQLARTSEPVKEFIGEVVRVVAAWRKMEIDRPLENWEPFLRESFLREGRPLVELVARAEALQGRRQNEE